MRRRLDQNDEDFPSETAKQILEVATAPIIAPELYFLEEDEDMLLQHGDALPVNWRYHGTGAVALPNGGSNDERAATTE